MANGNGNVVRTVALTIGASLVLAIFGLLFTNTYAGINERVDHNTELIEMKADALVVQTQYDAILREIQMLREDINRTER